MPNPYEDLFDNEEEQDKDKAAPKKPDFSILDDERFQNEGPEPLDEILKNIAAFNQQAAPFSAILSKTKAVDHKVDGLLSRLFFTSEKPKRKRSMKGEDEYHHFLQKSFREIIIPMRALAELHLKTVQQFNADIDNNYFSVEKTDHIVESEKDAAIDGIHLQRKILADAATSLEILEDALEATEKRIKKYINVGGRNNISLSAYELLVQKRKELVNKSTHGFDYTFFDINLLDKTALSLGIYLKETTSQYLGKLTDAFLAKP